MFCLFNAVSLFSLGAVFVTASGLDDMDSASSSDEYPIAEQATEREILTRQFIRKHTVLPDYTRGNEQGIIICDKILWFSLFIVLLYCSFMNHIRKQISIIPSAFTGKICPMPQSEATLCKT